MNFRDLEEVLGRLDRAERLSNDERRELYTWMAGAGDYHRHMLDLELTRRLLHAIRQFDKSSRTLTCWLIGLTIVLVVLTLVIAGFTILLAFKKS
ncbi:MAG TPA: hypothetical protein VGR81_01255 [Candidatus Acidoferrales bacterium]|nr:hypothetical protein [Candidatus Acidoferrales bacterium]